MAPDRYVSGDHIGSGGVREDSDCTLCDRLIDILCTVAVPPLEGDKQISRVDHGACE